MLAVKKNANWYNIKEENHFFLIAYLENPRGCNKSYAIQKEDTLKWLIHKNRIFYTRVSTIKKGNGKQKNYITTKANNI